MTSILLCCQGPIARLDAATFKVKVDGLVQHVSEYALADLQTTFPKVEVVAALQVGKFYMK